MEWLTVAIAKGRLEEEMVRRMHAANMAACIDVKSRKLIFKDERDQIQYIFVKPVDVVTYVEKGVADIGVVGKDIIMEQDLDVYEILDLQFGKCAFAVAGFPETNLYDSQKILRVATKYPNIASQYFRNKQRIEVTYLNGSVELAPIMDLADVIVDLVETGQTLRANGLVVLEKMHDIQAKVIANRVSYCFQLERMKKFLQHIEMEGGVSRVTNESGE